MQRDYFISGPKSINAAHEDAYFQKTLIKNCSCLRLYDYRPKLLSSITYDVRQPC